MKVTTETGALVNNVVEDSPAEKAGIKEEDVIIEFDGKKIDDADDLMRAVRDKKPGASLSVVVMRGNEKKTLNATLGKLPHSERSYSFTIPPIAPHPRIRMFHGDGMLGMSLLELNDQLGDYFGAPEGRGVLVKSVKQNSKAGKAGFKAGDVIIKIGKETVDDVDDVYSALSDYNEGDKVECEIIRKGSRTTLSLEVPETQDLHGYYFNFGPHSGMMKEFDIDLDDLPGKELHDFEIDHHNFRHDMEILRRNLQEMGRTIRDNLMKLRSELRVSLKNVVGA
jgi:S1-C subfamily serine protease